MDHKKFRAKLLLLLFFLIPSNLAYHFVLPSSYQQGILVDYLIPTVYLTDLVILVLLISWMWEKRKILSTHATVRKLIPAMLLIGFILLNIQVSNNRISSLFKWVKLFEFGLLFIYIKSQTFDIKYISKVVKVWCLSIWWQSILTIAQWFNQSNILPYWLMGESQFATTSSAVKTIDWLGVVRVIPMGTFPHPNVLAGWLTVSLIFLLKYWLSKINTNEKRANNWLLAISILTGIVTLGLTFSIVNWMVFGLVATVLILLKLKTKRLNKAIILGIVLIFCVWSLRLVDESSYLRRIKLNEISLKMWTSSPWIGVGLNNFVVKMNEFGEIAGNIRFLQPVHNVWLLVLAETGVMGLTALILLIGYLIKQKKWITLGTIIILSLFDHYFMTIQQGLLLAVIDLSFKNRG